MLRKIKNKMNLHYLVLIFCITCIFVIMSIQSPFFLTWNNIDVLVNNFIMEAIMALGMTMVIISGGIDISISGILPFIAIIFAKLMLIGVNPWLASLIGLVVSGTIGLFNNSLRHVLRLHPMIVTMATQLTLKGLNLAITGGSVLSKFSRSFTSFTAQRPLGLSIPIWIYILLAVLFVALSKHNRRFIHVFFVGGSNEASMLSGMKINSIFRMVYVISAILAGLAGILSVTVYNSASYSFGQGVEMKVITAVAIGGTSLTHGGEGSITGTLLGT